MEERVIWVMVRLINFKICMFGKKRINLYLRFIKLQMTIRKKKNLGLFHRCGDQLYLCQQTLQRVLENDVKGIKQIFTILP